MIPELSVPGRRPVSTPPTTPPPFGDQSRDDVIDDALDVIAGSRRGAPAPPADRPETDVDVDSGVDLTPISQTAADSLERELRTIITWEDDGLCFWRAATGTTWINRTKDTNRGDGLPASAIATVQRPEPPTELWLERGWNFHAVSVVHVEGADEPLVYDFVLGDEPMPLSEWTALLGVSPDAVTYAPPPQVHGLAEQLDSRTSTYGDFLAVTGGGTHSDAFESREASTRPAPSSAADLARDGAALTFNDARSRPGGVSDAAMAATSLPAEPTSHEEATTSLVGTIEGRKRAEYLESLLDRFTDHLDAVRDAHPEPFAHPTLEPVSRDLADEIADEVAGLVVWENDNLCLMRAVTAALLINLEHDADVADDAIPAGVAYVERPPGATGVWEETNWAFHAVTVVQVEGEAEPLVYDLVFGEEPMPLSEWAGLLGVRPEDVTITSPYVVPSGAIDNDPTTTIDSDVTEVSDVKLELWVKRAMDAWLGRWVQGSNFGRTPPFSADISIDTGSGGSDADASSPPRPRPGTGLVAEVA